MIGPPSATVYRCLAPAVVVGLTLVCLLPVANFGGGNPRPLLKVAGAAGLGLAVQLREAEELETDLG